MLLRDPLAVAIEVPDYIQLHVVLPPRPLRPQRLLEHVAMADGLESQCVHGGHHSVATHSSECGCQLAMRLSGGGFRVSDRARSRDQNGRQGEET